MGRPGDEAKGVQDRAWFDIGGSKMTLENAQNASFFFAWQICDKQEKLNLANFFSPKVYLVNPWLRTLIFLPQKYKALRKPLLLQEYLCIVSSSPADLWGRPKFGLKELDKRDPNYDSEEEGVQKWSQPAWWFWVYP